LSDGFGGVLAAAIGSVKARPTWTTEIQWTCPIAPAHLLLDRDADEVN
jgi:hypothetical protein